jgi:hypothetical protein
MIPRSAGAERGSRAALAALLAGVFCATSISLSSDAKEVSAASSNSLMVIAPYRHNGMWVFDDPAVGLSREPFIAGIDKMIDKLVADIPNAERGWKAIFSASPFPGHEVKLEWRREESGGNWYYADKYQMEGWLCPALFKYFDKAPREIYVRAEPRS